MVYTNYSSIYIDSYILDKKGAIMARQSLSPMKDFDYAEGGEAEAVAPITREKVGRKRKDAPMTHLKYLRKKSGYTLETLSEITNISISYLSRLESGSRRLNTDLIRRLSHAFSCSPAELLQEVMHDSSVITPVEFNKARRGDNFAMNRDITLNEIAVCGETGDLCLKPVSPAEWKQCPAELLDNENVIAVKAKDAFKPNFSESSTLYLDPNAALAPESMVVILKGDQVLLKKVWSITPTSLQLCDLSEVEHMKAGQTGNLMEVDRRSLNGLYKVVGYSDFDLG